ncbi:type II toxin-antitoxin system HicB family antitoxin [Bacteroides sp. 519]|uniref:type II toxin-antitoxin system HicB family antitoxin n=1 Tax=Bacteroides sp. 519 TaxID=2302937 RepID=UPI0013D48034|nr:type II toxin-antitoxin system HicB family antitoxin [Bacteroides sp. 519]NDV59146.1 type II toxin-antitoxin system HicB family antitoxin [Bacteroides sp. 519]
MEFIKVIVELADTNYSAYIEGVDGVVATGSTLDEIKANMAIAIEDFIEYCDEFGCKIPEKLKGEYELVFKMDVQCVLDFYSNVFSKAGLERITGINQKQLWHYASGGRKPRQEQVLKLERALHKLGEELLSINL